MDLFTAIYNSLPDELTSDVVFISMKNIFEEYLEKTEIDFSNPFFNITIPEEVFADIDFGAYGELRTKLDFRKDPDTLCTAFLTGEDKTISLTITKVKEEYKVKLGIFFKHGDEEIEYDYYKKNNNYGYLEIRKFIREKGHIINYDYEPRIYNNGKLVEADYEDAKDKEFVRQFAVPKELVREYRTHFSKYYQEINRYKSEDFMEYYDNKLLRSEDLRFQLFDNIDHFITYLRHYGMIRERIETYSKVLNGMKPNIRGSFVISVNILDNLQSYLLGLDENMKTRGIIISKNESDYTMYGVLFKETDITCLSVNEPQDKLERVFASGGYNVSDADRDEEEMRKYFEEKGIDPDTGRIL